ncbi:PrsW family intramembrane metalloprotease [Candidatus Gracilibacteria bacterium]|nr:PrsW family intramembrane metalloprotease [Candidatus Gracilibacteria bacterium]
MSVIWAILATLVIVYVRMRFIRNVFVDKKVKLNLTLKFFLIGILLVGWLFVYKYLLNYLGLGTYHFEDNLSIISIGAFVIYNIIFLFLVSLIYGNINKKNIFRFTILGVILFIGIAYGGYSVGLTVVLVYYFMSAYAEEIMKFGVSENMFIKNGKNKSDLIFFAILVGLGFSIIENLLYIGTNIFSEGINLLSLSVGRGITASTLHIATTGIIAYVSIKGYGENKNIKSRIYILSGIILGFSVHVFYNLSLVYKFSFIGIPLVVLSYFILNYLLFKSDLIYHKKKII